jgi:hypothetical protein
MVDNQSGSPNTYTQQATGSDAGGAKTYKWFAATNITVNQSTFTVTITVPAGYTSPNILEISGQANSSFVDQTSTYYNNASPLLCGVMTTTYANDLLLSGFNSPGFAGTMAVVPVTPDTTTYTLQSNQNDSGCCEASGAATAIVSTTGSYQSSFTGSGFGVSVCTSVAIKAAGGGGSSFTASPITVPTGNSANIVVSLTGVGTSWGGTTVMTASGVSGVSCGAVAVSSTTAATIGCTTSSTSGTVTITESVTGTSTTTIGVGFGAGSGSYMVVQ